MRHHHIDRGDAADVAMKTLPLVGLLLAFATPSFAQVDRNAAAAKAEACPGDNGGITLSPGFCATVFADNIGHARHLVVAPNGVVYVNTWSGRYYGNDMPPAGGFLVALQDTKVTGAPTSLLASVMTPRTEAMAALASHCITARSMRK